MRILETCLNKNCQVWTLKDNYRLGNDILSKVLAFAFGLAAEIERKLIYDRTKSSLANIKASGKKLGRPFNAETTFWAYLMQYFSLHIFVQFYIICSTLVLTYWHF